MTIEITTGYLTGNMEPVDPEESEHIDWDESLKKYDAMLEAALKNAYPGANIEILSQNGVGATPYSLQTKVYIDGNEDSDAAEDVEILSGDVWSSWEWVVYK